MIRRSRRSCLALSQHKLPGPRRRRAQTNLTFLHFQATSSPDAGASSSTGTCIGIGKSSQGRPASAICWFPTRGRRLADRESWRTRIGSRGAAPSVLDQPPSSSTSASLSAPLHHRASPSVLDTRVASSTGGRHGSRDHVCHTHDSEQRNFSPVNC
jgi:hypothetical protein